MSLLPGCWLEVKFKPINRVVDRIETLTHDAILGRVRDALIDTDIVMAIRMPLEDAIERS